MFDAEATLTVIGVLFAFGGAGIWLVSRAKQSASRIHKDGRGHKGAEQDAPESPWVGDELSEADEEIEPATSVRPTEVDPGIVERPTTIRESEEPSLALGLTSTRTSFVGRIRNLLSSKSSLDSSLIEQMEEVLITSDVGVRVATELLDGIQQDWDAGQFKHPSELSSALKLRVLDLLDSAKPPQGMPEAKPYVILVVGVNGVGKTTTIGKLAKRYADAGKSVVLAAGDTFRAAAVEQLEVWGRRVNCKVIKGEGKSSSGAVIFEAIRYAESSNADVIIADTAGRLHTSAPLMDELSKVMRGVQKALGGRPADEVLLVVDATTGQNATQQARQFSQAIPLTGTVLTKLDGSAKGGVSLAIVREFGLPIRYLGVGERQEDLRRFDAKEFVDALFDAEPNG